MLTHKRSEKQISPQKALKSKYLDKQKQKTIPLINRINKKIMLTDLCTEQKLKIGELIKTLQARKLQNEQLNQDIHQIKQKYDTCQERLIQVSQQLQKKQKQCQLLNQQLKELQRKFEQQQDKYDKLTNQATQYKEIVFKIKNQSKSNKRIQAGSMQTTMIQTQGTQTKQKKIKNKSIQVSCEMEQNIRESVFYRPHSKSFEKVMKGFSSDLKSSIMRSQNDIYSIQKEQKQFENQEAELQDTKGYKYCSQKNRQQKMSQHFDSLSKKWQVLKHKNKQQFKITDKSKINNIKYFQQFSQPRQFIEEQNQNFSEQQQHQSGIELFNQGNLNKMLKSKNFSASKLINDKSGFLSGSTFRKPSAKVQIQVHQIKKPHFKQKAIHKINIREQNKKDSASSSGNAINFCESGLLDFVDSIDQC